MKRFLKKLFCKHKIWHFYPDNVWFDLPNGKSEKAHGLVIYCCWKCGKITDVKDYAA